MIKNGVKLKQKKRRQHICICIYKKHLNAAKIINSWEFKKITKSMFRKYVQIIKSVLVWCPTKIFLLRSLIFMKQQKSILKCILALNKTKEWLKIQVAFLSSTITPKWMVFWLQKQHKRKGAKILALCFADWSPHFK